MQLSLSSVPRDMLGPGLAGVTNQLLHTQTQAGSWAPVGRLSVPGDLSHSLFRAFSSKCILLRVTGFEYIYSPAEVAGSNPTFHSVSNTEYLIRNQTTSPGIMLLSSSVLGALGDLSHFKCFAVQSSSPDSVPSQNSTFRIESIMGL